jgi:peptide/nickel transport system ATP-binding protein
MSDQEALIVANDLSKSYRVVENGKKITRTVVDQVSFQIQAGTTLGIVGESGSGKSTTARMLTRLLDPDAGSIMYQGQDVTELSGANLRRWRRNVQIVFQDPYSSLDPRMSIGEAIAFPLRVHGVARTERKRRVSELLERVGLRPALAVRRPRQLSGGQLQRINIARALALDPQLLVLDEPVSALDKSVQAVVINLLLDLQEELGLTYAFVSHDLNVIRYVSDEVVVMNAGRIVDRGQAKSLFRDSVQPYTRSLVDALESGLVTTDGRV